MKWPSFASTLLSLFAWRAKDQPQLRAFSPACHGAGRQTSRHQALKNWSGRQIVDELMGRGIIVKSPSQRGVAGEAPGAYKDAGTVIDATEAAGLAKKVVKLAPMICIEA